MSYCLGGEGIHLIQINNCESVTISRDFPLSWNIYHCTHDSRAVLTLCMQNGEADLY